MIVIAVANVARRFGLEQNKREFFRINVELPIYIHPLDETVGGEHVSKSFILPATQLQRVEQADSEIQRLFTDPHHIENGAVELFSEINQRINFLAYMLDELMEGRDPRHHEDFYVRLDNDHRICPPETFHTSKVFPLIEAFYQRIDEIVRELLEMMNRSAEGEIVFYSASTRGLFSGEEYLHNLSALAEQGNWLALVFVDLIAKLNVYESAYANLKAVSHVVPHPDDWLVLPVNLSAGGIALESTQPFSINDRVCVLMKIENTVLYAYADVVNIKPANLLDAANQEIPYLQVQRVSFKFEHLGADDAALITRFVTAQELACAHPDEYL